MELLAITSVEGKLILKIDTSALIFEKLQEEVALPIQALRSAGI